MKLRIFYQILFAKIAKLLHALKGVYFAFFAHNFRQKRRAPARAVSHVHYFTCPERLVLSSVEVSRRATIQKFEHKCHGIGLGNSLAAADRQGFIKISRVLQTFRHEIFSIHFQKRLDNLGRPQNSGFFKIFN